MAVSQKHYVSLAQMMGDGLAIALLNGGESARTEFYNEVYIEMTSFLASDNERFDHNRFAHAAGQAETAYLKAAAECGRHSDNKPENKPAWIYESGALSAKKVN